MNPVHVDIAIRFLRLGIGYSMDGQDPSTIVMADQSRPPSEEELQAAYDSLAYREKRASAYPPIGDQLDAIWGNSQEFEEMRLKIQAVKDANPKPT